MVCELLFLMNHLIAPAVSPIKIYGLSKWDKSLVHFPITLWFPINDHYQDLLPQTPEIFLPLKQHHLNAPWPPQTSPTPTASLHQWYHLGSNSYQGNLNHLPSFILPLSSHSAQRKNQLILSPSSLTSKYFKKSFWTRPLHFYFVLAPIPSHLKCKHNCLTTLLGANSYLTSWSPALYFYNTNVIYNSLWSLLRYSHIPQSDKRDSSQITCISSASRPSLHYWLQTR